MAVQQVRMIRGPYKGRIHDVEPYVSGSCAKLRPEEAATLLKEGWAVPVRSEEPTEAAVAPPPVERAVKRKATQKKAKKVRAKRG